MTGINIVLAREEHTPDLTFVEIENDEGKSIYIGEVISSTDYVTIRITAKDIEEAIK